MSETTSIITGVCRFSYVSIFEKKSIDGGTPQYSIALLIPKSDKGNVKKIKAAIQAAVESGLSTLGIKEASKLPKNFKTPLRDGDDEKPDDPAYEGHYFINAVTKNRRPGIVDKNRKEIIDPEVVYSGCYGRADINFYAFNVSGNKGVACGLNNIQKIKEGEPLSGVNNAENAFDDDFTFVDDDIEDDDDMLG